MLRDVDAVVLGGGPQSLCNEEDRNSLSGLAETIVKTDRPVLGICLSHHLIAYAFKGVVGKADKPEYGEVEISVIDEDVLFDGLPKKFIVWESHSDEVKVRPNVLVNLASSENCMYQAFKHRSKDVFSVQFHPEVSHTMYGRNIFENFIKHVRS